MESKLEIGAPEEFGMQAVIVENLFSLLPTGVLMVTTLILSSLAGALTHILFGAPASALVFLFLIVLMLFVSLYLMLVCFPFMQANPYVRHLVEKRHGWRQSSSNAYICQLSLSPRFYSGLRGFLEDADDIGWLEIKDDGIVFKGDSMNLSLPFEAINRIATLDRGYRMLGMGGRKVRISTRALDGIQAFELVERQSYTIDTSRRLADDIIDAIEYGWSQVRGEKEQRTSE